MQILRAQGCDQAQGTFFSPAVSVKTLANLLGQASPHLSEERRIQQSSVPNDNHPGLLRKLAHAFLPKRATHSQETERTEPD
jgi:hypothetical protein